MLFPASDVQSIKSFKSRNVHLIEHMHTSMHITWHGTCQIRRSQSKENLGMNKKMFMQVFPQENAVSLTSALTNPSRNILQENSHVNRSCKFRENPQRHLAIFFLDSVKHAHLFFTRLSAASKASTMPSTCLMGFPRSHCLHLHSSDCMPP